VNDDDLRAALQEGLTVLASADEESARWPALRSAIEKAGPAALAELLPSGYGVKGSTGIGNAAAVPWLAVFPPGAATSAKTGIYLVYLFAADGSAVYLSLNQAGSQVNGGVQALRKRALDLRSVVGEEPDLLNEIDLGSTGPLSRRYAAGNAYAIRYRASDLADGATVGLDLARMVGLLERISIAGVSFNAQLEPLHLLFKWSADREPQTVERHRVVAQHEGSVWWGKFAAPGSTGMGASKLADLQGQLQAGVRTHAYIYRQDDVWKARLVELTTDAADVDIKRMAGYYDHADCSLFARLSNFEQLSISEFRASVLLASNPDPATLSGALGNQQNPLFLYERWQLSGSNNRSADSSPPPALTLEWLSEQTLWPIDRLAELITSLTDASPQVVLAGPPGTGKTWVADLVARYLTNDAPLQHRTVQFHPSYGYEEFVEGLRPVLSEHQTLAFDRVDGTVLQLAAAAAESDQPHVLIIDEMNRANIPRVFGELMYLLEYRNRPLTLMYTENFELPRNLLFIGTMNTADRSIRSIDVALRRRFDIFDCPPDAGILQRFYAQSGNSTSVAGLADGFAALNDALTEEIDRHHTVGHTFFMSSDFDAAALRRTWVHQLAPLIEDYFFDRPDIASSYTLERFWPSVDD
jgi:hypothetical protein